LTRHDLKEQLQHDHFTDAVSGVVSYAQANRQQITRWVVIVVALLLVAGGVWGFRSYQKGQRQTELSSALTVVNVQVGPASEFTKTFPTEEAKNAAASKALSDVVAKDGSSNEGMIALYNLATLKAKKDQNSAAADFKRVADSGRDVAPLAKIALAQIYMGQNKPAEAKDLLRSIVSNPTDLVSKAQAQILLAQTEATANPLDSKGTLKMISADDQKRPAVSRAADALSAQLK
jgi:hypothetical protein